MKMLPLWGSGRAGARVVVLERIQDPDVTFKEVRALSRGGPTFEALLPGPISRWSVSKVAPTVDGRVSFPVR
jgi:hypothetical protein